MRTTLRLNERLLKEAKKYAVETDRSLTAVIEDALRELLARRRRNGGRKRAKLTTFGRGGPLPGVDLDDSAGLRERMEDIR